MSEPFSEERRREYEELGKKICAYDQFHLVMCAKGVIDRNKRDMEAMKILHPEWFEEQEDE